MIETTLLIISLLLNAYLFYRYIREHVKRIDCMYNHTQRVLDKIGDNLDRLSENNNKLEHKVTEMINRKSNRHENI